MRKQKPWTPPDHPIWPDTLTDEEFKAKYAHLVDMKAFVQALLDMPCGEPISAGLVGSAEGVPPGGQHEALAV